MDLRIEIIDVHQSGVEPEDYSRAPVPLGNGQCYFTLKSRSAQQQPKTGVADAIKIRSLISIDVLGRSEVYAAGLEVDTGVENGRPSDLRHNACGVKARAVLQNDLHGNDHHRYCSGASARGRRPYHVVVVSYSFVDE